MFVINDGFMYVAVILFIGGLFLMLERYVKLKIFSFVPAIVWIYVVCMILCTMGVFSSEEVSVTYSGLKNNLLYGMIFILMLRCDFRKLARLGPRMAAIFLGGSFTLGIGTLIGYPIFVGGMGGVEDTWAAVSALYASWVGGSGNMAAMAAAFESSLNEGAYGAALALDTVCYSVWIAVLLLVVRYAPKWNQVVKADTSKLDAVADAAGAERADRTARSGADPSCLAGRPLVGSVGSQKAGAVMDGWLCSAGLEMFGASTCTTLFVTILGLICALSPLGRLSGVEELSSLYLYSVVSMLASQASLTDLVSAPVWVVYGFAIIAVHAILMFVLSKLFRWDLCMVSTASLANIGGSASAPIVATAYNPSFAGIGVLMGVMGTALGNFFGLGMGAILQSVFL